jgi:hypothetical protein
LAAIGDGPQIKIGNDRVESLNENRSGFWLEGGEARGGRGFGADRSLPRAWKGPTQGRRHRGSIGLSAHLRMVSQKTLKGAHNLSPFDVGLSAIGVLSGYVPAPRESAGESAGDDLGEHFRSWVAFLPAGKQPLRRYVRAPSLDGSRKRYCGKSAGNEPTLAYPARPSGPLNGTLGTDNPPTKR